MKNTVTTNSTNQVVKVAAKIVSQHVHSPKVVREGIVKVKSSNTSK